MSCSLMHDPCIFLCKKGKQNKAKTKKKRTKRSHTTFLVTCVGYHDNGYRPTLLGLYTHFSKKMKMIENDVNMVPNAWFTRKVVVPRASHANLIIAFSMHSISMPESFISMMCGRSIGNQKFLFLGLWGWTKHLFQEKFHQVKVKYGSNQLAKVRAKDGSSYIVSLSIATHNCANSKKIEDYCHPCVISSFTLMRWNGPSCFNENLNWFNPMSCVKFAIPQQCVTHIHSCFSLVALLIAFFPWNQNCNHCNQKERTRFMAPLPNAR